ncbi:MAG: nucleotidyltransferase substrate binding protein [Candidatus Hydrogenedentes bacterium]|nr:nucleotidyltransferase substrate binding protein [Candidatus Hydrogenedentota bacterium]
MSAEDTRWIQRLTHFSKAFCQLTKFIEKGELNDLEKQGLIQSFEYTYELAWNLIKDYFEVQGDTNIHGSRDAFRLAFKRGLLEDGKTWMEMVESRTLTVHTYNEDIANKIADDIVNRYFPEFEKLKNIMNALKEKTP